MADPLLVIRRIGAEGELDRFVDFPERLHAGDEARVPPLREVLRRRLRGGLRSGRMTLLLAERAGEVVGTVSVLQDRRHEQHRGEATAFFGFFECVDDVAVARALMNAAADRARELGADSLRGPRNFSRVEPVGVVVEGHEAPPPMLAGHSPAYYARLLEACGLVAHHDVLAFETPLVDGDGQPRALPDKLRAKADAVSIDGLQIRDANRWRLLRDLKRAHAVFVGAFRDVPDNTPMPLRQFVAIGWVFLAVTDHRMLQIATVHGEPAGFALCFPELNGAVVRARGRLLPFGWLRVLLGIRKVRTASFKLIGVMPEHRHSGLHAAMIRRAIDGVQRAGYERLEASLIDARNGPSRGLVESSGMTVYKRYRLYHLPLAEPMRAAAE
jgi:GNAT superfamily N-acetyltransferase